LTRKFHKSWTGPFKIVKKFSALNYRIVDQNGKLQAVNLNRLKRAYNTEVWKNKFEHRTKKRWKREPRKPSKQFEEEEVKFNPFPLVMTDDSLGTTGREPSPLQTPEITQSEVDTPCSELKYPRYHPPEKPKSRREFESTRTEPPITGYRARIVTRFCKLTPVLHCYLIELAVVLLIDSKFCMLQDFF